MTKNLILFAASLVILPAIDYFWLSNMLSFYLSQYGELARKEAGQFNLLLAPALLVYLVLALGLVVFVLPRVNRLAEAPLYGATFGLVIYGVYDLTNLATLQGYTWTLTVVDMTWGTILNGLAVTLVYLLREKIS